MSEWILCKSWWPPKKGQRAKFSKLWLLGILGPFRTCGSEVNGSDDSDVRHVLGHDSCCGPDYYAFPVPRLECGMGPGGLGSLVPWSPGKKALCLVDPLFFCFEGLMIDFSSHGEDTHFYIGTDGDLFQIAAHGDSLYLMNLVTDRYTMNVLITTLFFEEGFHFFQFSS